MPRHKATPKKHENEPSTSISKNLDEKNTVDDDDKNDNDEAGEVLDLSVKRRKVDNKQKNTDQKSKNIDQKTKTGEQKQNSKNQTNFASSQRRFDLNDSLAPLYPGNANFSTTPFFDVLSGFPSSQPLAPSTSTSTPYKNVLCQSVSQNDSLSKLTNLVSKVGKTQSPSDGGVGVGVVTSTIQDAVSGGGPGNGLNFQELWWRFVKKEENAELKRLNEAKQIFTCLQCQASFQSMDQLVKHMEATQHYANIPKHYSWSLQYARQKMRQMKMKMKYSDKMMYFCFLCQVPFNEPVHVHFNCAHNMHNPAENMKFVQIISVGSESCSTSSSPSKQNRRKISLPSPCGTSTTNGSDCSGSPLQHSATPYSNSPSDIGSPEKSLQIKLEPVEHRPEVDDAVRRQEILVKNHKSHSLLSKMEELVQNAMKEQCVASSTRK